MNKILYAFKTRNYLGLSIVFALGLFALCSGVSAVVGIVNLFAKIG